MATTKSNVPARRPPDAPRSSSWFLWQAIFACSLAATLFVADRYGNLGQYVGNFGQYAPNALLLPLVPSSLLSLDRRVARIMSRTPLIDGHIDLAERVRTRFGNNIYTSEFTKFEHGGFPDHVDIPRLLEGKQGGFFWSAWVNCPRDGFDFSNENYAPIVIETLSQIDVIHRLQAAHPKLFSPATLDSSSALTAFRRHKRLVSPIGVEGLHMMGRNASTLRLFHSLGARYATLTWNCHNAVADAAQITLGDDPLAAGVAKPHWGGLSPLGTKIIREMNRLGMIVDLAHVHPATMHDVLAGNSFKSFNGTEAPVIFSHSSAKALCHHPRNVPDDVLPLVQKTDSVVMVSFVPQFTSCIVADTPDAMPTFDPVNATLERVADHITYIGEKIGYRHIGIGSDYDGMPDVPQGLEDVSKYPDLVKELARRGLSDQDLEGIIGGNVLRVWKRVEDVSKEMQASGVLPLEDEI